LAGQTPLSRIRVLINELVIAGRGDVIQSYQQVQPFSDGYHQEVSRDSLDNRGKDFE
jgi:hypothetical protein